MTAFVQRRFIFIHALAWALFPTVSAVFSQDDEDSPYRPGLVATYSAAGETITRTDETIAFDWQDSAPDSRLPAGNFNANWKGRLWARGAGQYHLHAFVHGDVTVKLAGKTIIAGASTEPKWLESQPLDLDFDHHPLDINYTRNSKQGQLALFWSGPDFRLEPIPAWALVHDRGAGFQPAMSFERGRQLATALRCAACHKDSAASVTPAPALDRLSGNIHESWLVDWLNTPTRSVSEGPNVLGQAVAPRRMPHLNITREEATAIAAYLLREPPIKIEQKNMEQKEAKVAKEDSKKKSDTKSTKKSKGEEKPKPSAAEGEKLLLTRGCLACHQLGANGLSGLFGGGDLSSLLAKRPAHFLTRWLDDPAAINRDHRMPVFQFTADEITSLNLWTKQQSTHQPEASARENRVKQPETLEHGRKLVESLKCAACHSLSRDKNTTPTPDQKELTSASNWKDSCTNQPNRAKNQPGYQLATSDATALQNYYSTAKPGATHLSQQTRGRDLLAQLNCLACHQREGAERASLSPLADSLVGWAVPTTTSTSDKPTATLPALQDKLPALAESHPTLAPLIPAMTPPALNSVGDKLHDQALSDSITREGPPHRPYLLVQMPKFELSKDQLACLTAYFTSTDRIPSVPANLISSIPNPKSQIPNSEAALAAAGPRLVTTDGLACTSCHQVGSVLPTKAPLNARGPDMSMLGSRIRREWFDRWCNNPARIVPRMEMPAVKIPVRGVLNDNVEDQLAAVWHILNTPGFQPPEPDPVRVLRLSGLPEKNERPLVIHDIFKDNTAKDGDKTYLFPLVIGLPNRHNILFDLETNRLAAWWLGDTARQRTKGKSWYWEMGGKSIFDPGFNESELSISIDGKERYPQTKTQFLAELQRYSLSSFEAEPEEPGSLYLTINRRFPKTDTPLHDGGPFVQVQNTDSFGSYRGTRGPGTGFTRVLFFIGEGSVERIRMRLLSSESARNATWEEKSRTLRLSSPAIAIRLVSPSGITWHGDGSFSIENDGKSFDQSGFRRSGPADSAHWWSAQLKIDYLSEIAPDHNLSAPVPPAIVKTAGLTNRTGLDGTRLPLSADIMPSALAWDNQGDLIFATLKGQIIRARDVNRDGNEDSTLVLADGLSAPYGIAATGGVINVCTKNGLLWVENSDIDVRKLYSGWGHTDDYHDWAVGLVEGEQSQYFIALPCQQDQRSEAAAAYRGRLLKLTPRRDGTRESSNLFDIEIISAGHRFPMGMARNRNGELFVTDNQGNYNPFNELNHVKPGAHFGFINALEKEKGFTPHP